MCRDLGDICSTTSMTCVRMASPATRARPRPRLLAIYLCGTSGTCLLRPRLGETCDATQSDADCIDRSYCEPATIEVHGAERPTTRRACPIRSARATIADFDTNLCTTRPICI